MTNNNRPKSDDEKALAFWTAPPIKHGLPALIATAILLNLLGLKMAISNGRPFDWLMLLLLGSFIYCAVYVQRRVKHLRKVLKIK